MTHKYKIGDWVRVVNMNGFYQIDDFEHQGMASITDETGNEWWPHPMYLTPAVVTLAEWDKLLPGGVMVGDVFAFGTKRYTIAGEKDGKYYSTCQVFGGGISLSCHSTFTLISRAPLALKDMTPEQAGLIMEAFRQGGALQKWIGGRQGWMTMAPGSRIKPTGMYRLPPKPVATPDTVLADLVDVVRAMLQIRAVWTDPHNDAVCKQARAALAIAKGEKS